MLYVATLQQNNQNHVEYLKELKLDPAASKLFEQIYESFKKEANEWQARKLYVRKLALRMEAIKVEHGLQNEIHTICSEIIKSFKSAGMTEESRLRWIWRAFDKDERDEIDFSKFKDERVFSKSLTITGNLPEENIRLVNTLKEAFTLIKTVDYHKLTQSQIQDLYENLSEATDRASQICQEQNIAQFSQNTSNSNLYSSNGETEMFPEPINTPKPEYEWTEISDACKRVGNIWIKIGEEAANFPPQIMAERKSIAIGINTLGDFIESGGDRKHKRTPMDWIAHLRSTQDVTINGTATLHPTESNLCHVCRQPDALQDPHGTKGLTKLVQMSTYELTEDELNMNMKKESIRKEFMKGFHLDPMDAEDIQRIMKIREKGYTWRCPQCKGVKGMEIIVSREHTSDMIKPTIDLMTRVVNHFPALVNFLKLYRDWRQPWLDSQTINLSPKLKSKKSG